MAKTLVNLANDLMLKSENIEYKGGNLKNRLDNSYVRLYDGVMNEKKVYTLKDNVNNYNEIHIFATNNQYNHHIMGTVLKEEFHSWTYQLIMYSPSDYDNLILIYDNIIDLTSSSLGENNKKIVSIYGVR